MINKMNKITTYQELENTTKVIKRLLQTNSLARNSTKGCIFLAWKEICEEKGIVFDIPFKLFLTLPSNETISRVKRHIQNTEHSCRADPETEKFYKIKEKEFKNYYGKKD